MSTLEEIYVTAFSNASVPAVSNSWNPLLGSLSSAQIAQPNMLQSFATLVNMLPLSELLDIHTQVDNSIELLRIIYDKARREDHPAHAQAKIVVNMLDHGAYLFFWKHWGTPAHERVSEAGAKWKGHATPLLALAGAVMSLLMAIKSDDKGMNINWQTFIIAMSGVVLLIWIVSFFSTSSNLVTENAANQNKLIANILKKTGSARYKANIYLKKFRTQNLNKLLKDYYKSIKDNQKRTTFSTSHLVHILFEISQGSEGRYEEYYLYDSEKCNFGNEENNDKNFIGRIRNSTGSFILINYEQAAQLDIIGGGKNIIDSTDNPALDLSKSFDKILKNNVHSAHQCHQGCTVKDRASFKSLAPQASSVIAAPQATSSAVTSRRPRAETFSGNPTHKMGKIKL